MNFREQAASIGGASEVAEFEHRADDIFEAQLQYLGSDCIDVGCGRRDLKTEFVEELALSIQETGLIQPITVRPGGVEGRYNLIAGFHRLEAVRRLGSKFIAAYVVNEEVGRGEIAEIDENFFRQELSSAELAGAIGRRDLIVKREKQNVGCQLFPKIWENILPMGEASNAERRAARGRKRDPHSARALAQVSGWSEETIRKSRKRVEVLGLSVLSDVSGTDLDSNSELDALCALPEAERLLIVAEAKRQARASPSERLSVSAKLRGQSSSTPRQRLLRAWENSSDVDRKWFLEFIERRGEC